LTVKSYLNITQNTQLEVFLINLKSTASPRVIDSSFLRTGKKQDSTPLS